MSVLKHVSRAAAAALLLLCAGQARAATIWECYVYNPLAKQPSVAAVVNLTEEVKEKTNGALVINVHLGGSLPIKADGITAGVTDGVIQFADDGFATGTVPVTGVYRLPMLIQSEAEMQKAIEVLKPYVTAAYAKRGIEALAQYSYPVQVIWGKKKIEHLSDIKGLKMRVTSVEQGELIRRFGGVPLTLGAPDVAAALDRGVVEGALTASSGGGIAWHDLLKYRYAFPTSWVNSTYIVNKEAMAALPAEQQQILRAAAVKWAAWAIQEQNRQEDELTAQFQKEGMILANATPEEVKEATARMASYWDEWAKTKPADAKEALAKLRQAVGR
jgi:TRAP-type C4-dicarboxylate transport system substrate-binding protein